MIVTRKVKKTYSESDIVAFINSDLESRGYTASDEIYRICNYDVVELEDGTLPEVTVSTIRFEVEFEIEDEIPDDKWYNCSDHDED